MTLDELKQFYESNEDFEYYVDRYCCSKNISVEQALTHKIVQVVAERYATCGGASNVNIA